MKRVLISVVVLLISALIIQGFQCASKEMTTAKMKYEQKDYDAAIENLEIELAKNPTNEEALDLMIRIRMARGELREAAQIILDAESKSTNPKYKDKFPFYKNNLWVESYNQGITLYQKYFNTQDVNYLDSAIAKFDVGAILRPTMNDFYFLMGNCYELKGDTAKFLEQYDKYIKQLDEEINYASSNSIYLNMEISEVLSKIGKETKSRMDTSNTGITRVDILSGTDEIYLYSSFNDKVNQFELKGWRVGFPSDWTNQEKLRFNDFKVDLFFILSEYYYSNKQLEKSLNYLELYQKIDPTNNNSNSSIVQIYKDLGKEDEALNKLEGLTKKEPSNPLYWSMWADMLANLEKHDEAIEKYQKALEIDPNYDFALRNIASTYKNKAVQIQNYENEKVENDKNYKVDVEKYFPLLEKSSEYFEKALKTETFKNDYLVLIELANNYIVLGNKSDPRLKKVLTEIEKVEFKVPEEEKLAFYYKWLKIASDMGDTQRINNISRKIELLEKN